MALIAMIAGLSYPAVSSGLDSLRLRSTSDAIVSFLNIALDHADRRQQAVEVIVSPRENILLSRTADLGFSRRLDIPAQIHIVSVQPALAHCRSIRRSRASFLLYPGGSVPRIGIEISTLQGRRRLVSVDPVTGSPRSEVVSEKKQQRGFTLLEALVATMIMGIAVAGILDALAASSRNVARLTQADRAVLLARTKMDELLANDGLPRKAVSGRPLYRGRGRRHDRRLARARHAHRSRSRGATISTG